MTAHKMKMAARQIAHERVTLACGCVNDIGGGITFCPLHAAAPALLAALTNLCETPVERLTGHDWRRAQAAIRLAEGDREQKEGPR